MVKKLSTIQFLLISLYAYLQPSNTGFAGCVDEGEGSMVFSSLFPKLPMDTSISRGLPASSRSHAPASWHISMNLLVPRYLWRGRSRVIAFIIFKSLLISVSIHCFFFFSFFAYALRFSCIFQIKLSFQSILLVTFSLGSIVLHLP